MADGEAKMATCTLLPNGDLFIRKHRGGVMFLRFYAEEAADYCINKHNETNLMDIRPARREGQPTIARVVREFLSERR
jgi:hypothetical protein